MRARKINSNNDWEEVEYVQLRNSYVITKADQMEFDIPHDTADQSYERFVIAGAGLNIPDEKQYCHNGDMPFKLYNDIGVPCWSLSALLSVIPREIFDGEYIINITDGCNNRWILTYDHYENRNHSYYGLSTGADTPIDACVEIIFKLHELKLI